jgi:hypothetical protein
MDLKNRILRLRQDLVKEAVLLTTSSKTNGDKRVDDLVLMAHCRGAIDTLHTAIKAMESLVDRYELDQIALDTLYRYYGNYLSQQVEANPREPDASTRGHNAAVNLILDKLESLFSDLQRENSAGSYS